jgi:hypothetical protein
MANETILQKPTAGALTGAEFLYLVQNGTDRKGTINIIAEFLGSGVYSASVDTSGSTITLDMSSFKDAILTGSASIGAGKTIAFSNASNGKRLNFLFTLTDNYALVFPSTVKMQNWVGDWNSGTYTWTPAGGAGAYRAELYYNGTNWLMNIYGPH